MFQRKGFGEVQLFTTYIALNELNEISPCIKKNWKFDFARKHFFSQTESFGLLLLQKTRFTYLYKYCK